MNAFGFSQLQPAAVMPVDLSKTTNPFARALAALKGVVRTTKREQVTYNAIDFQLEAIAARKGATPFRIETETQFNLLIRSVDFVIAVDDLKTPAGDPFEPKAGHKIIHTQLGTVTTYEVLQHGDEQAARYSDSTRTEWRIHTKEIHSEAAS